MQIINAIIIKIIIYKLYRYYLNVGWWWSMAGTRMNLSLVYRITSNTLAPLLHNLNDEHQDSYDSY